MWYIVVKDLRNGREQFIEHYDKFNNILDLTEDKEFRQEYLSADSVAEEVKDILTNQPECFNYELTICFC